MINGVLEDEKLLIGLSFFFLIFLMVTIELTPVISVVYSAMLFGYAIFLNMYGHKMLQWSRVPFVFDNVAISIIIGMIAWLAISSVFMSMMGQAFDMFNMAGVIQMFAEQVQVRFRIDNIGTKFVTWGLAVPIIETMLLGVLIFFLKRMFKITRPRDMWNFQNLMIIMICASVFALLHIVARMMSNMAMIIDMVFFGISTAMILYFNELKQAGYLHIIVNSMVILI